MQSDSLLLTPWSCLWGHFPQARYFWPSRLLRCKVLNLGWAIPFQDWAAVMVLGVMGTGLATWSYFVVVAERGPGFLSTINYLIPAVAFLAGTLWLSEPWSVKHLIALALILMGCWVNSGAPGGLRERWVAALRYDE